MKMYFSGIASPREAEMLAKADVSQLLADPQDWKNVRHQVASSVALDSGAYRQWKRQTPITDLDLWADQIYHTLHTSEDPLFHEFDGKKKTATAAQKLAFITMPDVLGDPAETWTRWQNIREWFQFDGKWVGHHYNWSGKLIPVWQWGGDIQHLEEMVEWAKMRRQHNKEDKELFGQMHSPEADLVAIGGCVPWMRDKDEAALAELLALSKKWGEYFHILGLNWLDAIMELDPFVASCDTSKWLDGARYGIWINDANGRLVTQEKRTCPRGQDRADLCVQSAITLDNWINKRLRDTAAPKPRNVRHYTLHASEGPAPRFAGRLNANKLLLAHSIAEGKKRHEEAKEDFLDRIEIAKS
jgi:hypothetical protein